jgi:hypothetical protein
MENCLAQIAWNQFFKVSNDSDVPNIIPAMLINTIYKIGFSLSYKKIHYTRLQSNPVIAYFHSI